MARYSGIVGFAVQEEQLDDNGYPNGVWVDTIVERFYKGDTQRNSRRLQSVDSLNDDITIGNEISIVADPYAFENYYAIRYATFNGIKWKVSNADVQYPRIVLSLGSVYHES